MSNQVVLTVTKADNQVVAFLNGQEVYNKRNKFDSTADDVDLTPFLKSGSNSLLLVGADWGVVYEFAGSLTIYDQPPIPWAQPQTPSTDDKGVVWSRHFEILAK